MEASNDSDPFVVDGQLHTALKVALDDIALMPQSEQRTLALRGIASMLMGTPETFKAASLEQCPELASVEPLPDTYLSAEEQETASSLTLAHMQALDSALVAGTVSTWRSVSRVVGDALVTLQGQLPALPLGICIRRVQGLVSEGRLEAQGNIQFMRLSEVRLPIDGPSAE